MDRLRRGLRWDPDRRAWDGREQVPYDRLLSPRGRPLRRATPAVQRAFHWIIATQVFTLRYHTLLSLLSPLMVSNLVARGREAGFDPQDIRSAVREGLELGLLLSQGPAFIPSPAAETIIAFDHSLQVGHQDQVRVPVLTLHEVVHALEEGDRTRGRGLLVPSST